MVALQDRAGRRPQPRKWGTSSVDPIVGTIELIPGRDRLWWLHMKLVGRDKLVAFVRRHADARAAVNALTAEVEHAEWKSPHDVVARYPSASVIGGNDVVFNVRGNTYRIHARIAFGAAVVRIVRCGTHAEYDRWKF